MKFNYLQLKIRMTEKEVSIDMLASRIDMKYHTLFAKMKNESQFKQSEIMRICIALGIPLRDAGKYFLVPDDI